MVGFTKPERPTKETSSLYIVGLQWPADRVATGPILPGEAQGSSRTRKMVFPFQNSPLPRPPKRDGSQQTEKLVGR